MFPVHCSQCSRKSFSAGIPRCLHCGNVEPRTDAGDNFNPTEPEAQKKYGTASGSKTFIHPNDMHMDGVVHTIDRNIYQSNNRITTNNSEDHKECRNEIDKIRGHVLKIYSEQSGLYTDFPSTSRIAVDLVMQDQDNLKKTIQQSSASNLGGFQSTIYENLRINTSNFEPSKRGSIYSDKNFNAVPGPSGLHCNKNMPNLSEEEFLTRFSLELQSAVEMHKANSLCGICRWEIDKHCFEDQGKFLYKCCECYEVFSESCDLQKHTGIHPSDFLPCHICGEFLFGIDAHDLEKICNVCLEKFRCRTLLEQHVLVHDDYYHSNCRVCGTKIADHFDSVTKFYNCCHCEYSKPWKSYFQKHLHIHTGLKIFKCDVCGRRFAQHSYLCEHLHIHFKCKICSNSFTNKKRLEMHLIEEHSQP